MGCSGAWEPPFCVCGCGGPCDRVEGEDCPAPLGREKVWSGPPEAGVPKPWAVPVALVPLHPLVSEVLALTSSPSCFRHMLVDRLSKGEEVGTAHGLRAHIRAPRPRAPLPPRGTGRWSVWCPHFGAVPCLVCAGIRQCGRKSSGTAAPF